MSERSLQEGGRAQEELLLPLLALSLILGWVGERERGGDAIEEGCYIRDVGGVSSTHCGRKGKKKTSKESGPCRKRVRAVEGRGWFGCSARCHPFRSEAGVTPS